MNREAISELREVVARIGDVVRGELSIDRTGIRPLSTSALSIRAAVWVGISALFLVGWGTGTVRAVQYLLDPAAYKVRPYASEHAGAYLLELGSDCIVCVAALALIACFRAYSGSPRPRVAFRTGWRAFFVAFTATALGFACWQLVSVALRLPMNGYPYPAADGAGQLFPLLVGAAIAGPMEELALLGVVVVGLRTVGESWWLVAGIAVLVRVPFHVYYGWGSIGLAVWPILIVALYRRTGALWAIVLAHSTFDLLNYVPYGAGSLLKIAAFLAGVVIVLLHFIRRVTPPRSATRQQT